MEIVDRERLLRLERAGLVKRGSRRLDLAALRRPRPRAAKSVVAALLEDRREGR